MVTGAGRSAPWRWLSALATLAGVAVGAPAAAAPPPARPNILVIVADDLGYSDISPFGGEIRTPNLQALADRGLRLSGFHTAPTCSPTRSMLLTGADNHEVGLGSMAEATTAAEKARPGYEGQLNHRAATVAERLRQGGYMTLMAGKWHLGLTADGSPAARGFDRSYVLLQGGHDHFGDDQQPLWVKAGVGADYREDGRLTSFPTGLFSADVFASRMIGYLAEAKAAGKPFFGYLAFTEPHWPLQAPAEDIARYRGRYAEGYEVLRMKRLARLKRLGLAPADAVAGPLAGVKPWAELSAEEKAAASRKMEVYAAMVDRMDQNIGRVVAALEANGQFDNTVVIFMSDNGADGAPLNGPPGPRGLVDPQTLGLDNGTDNIGRRNSYVSYGRGWAAAATAPSRDLKGSVYEGGIHTPALVAGPGVKGAGRVVDATLHVMDITPTALALAGVDPAATPAELPIRGRSWLPLLAGSAAAVRGPDEFLNWELFFGRAVRQGDWKAVYAPTTAMAAGAARPTPFAGQWRLYDLKADPGETTDLAEREPARLAQMVAAWDDYAARTGVVAGAPPASAAP